MARTTVPLVELAPYHLPLFADPTRDYHWVAGYDSWQRDGNAVSFAVYDDAGNKLSVRLTFVEPAVLRVQLFTPGATEPPPTPMLLQTEWPPVTLTVEEHADGVRLRTSALTVEVNRARWQMRVLAAGRPLYRQEVDDFAFDAHAAYPLGYSISAAGEVRTHETFSLAVDEHLYGLGGQFGAFDKRGQRHVSWLREAYGTNTTPVAYMEVPFFQSSRGYGIFVNHGERITYELGHPSTVSGSFAVDAPVLDYFLIAGPDPATLLYRYTALTGRPALPPRWSFGVWMSRCMYRNRAEVEEVVTRMRALDIPLDVIHLDPAWLESRRTRPIDGCDFEWDHEAWGDPAALIDWLRQRGVRLSLWENPYLWRDCDMFTEGAARGYLVAGPDGAPASPIEYPGQMALIDYSNPEAIEWVKEKHRRWLRLGVAAFKSDYGEGAPPEGLYNTSRSGGELHNLYPLLYNRAVFEVLEEVHGAGNAMVFGRSGYAGSQRYPLQWSGDAQATWGGMAGALRCGLSQTMSGIAFWTADIGGFYTVPGFGPPSDPVLYIRWLQWGLLLSHARFHGIGPHEPWHYGDEAVRVMRDFTRLRYRLLPYLWSLAHTAAETGLPLLRPLALEFPDDPVAPHVETQFMLGPSLLVCPVFNAEGRCRVYLPAGRWHDWWDGTVHEGPRHLDLTVPLDRLPLFVRDGAVLPLAPEMAHVEAAPWQPLELRLWGESADCTLWTPERRVAVHAQRRHDQIEVRIDNAAQRWRVRLMGVTARDASLTGAATGLVWSVDGGDTVAEFESSGQGSAQLSLVCPPAGPAPSP